MVQGTAGGVSTSHHEPGSTSNPVITCSHLQHDQTVRAIVQLSRHGLIVCMVLQCPCVCGSHPGAQQTTLHSIHEPGSTSNPMITCSRHR